MSVVKERTATRDRGTVPLASPPAPRSIPLSIPEICGNEWTYVKECLDTGWVSSVGPFVDQFERAVARYVGATYAVAAASGTAALHTALQVIGVKPDEAVLVSALTFIAPVNAIRYCGAHPIFIDAHPQTWQMDVDKVEQFLESECERRGGACYHRRSGKRVRAIVPVHILGLSCEMNRIMELARCWFLRVVEDAAEGMGVRYHSQHVGTFGDVGVFSFNGNKIITTGGGGMLVSHRAEEATRARYLTTQAKREGVEYIHDEVGYNYRLTNIQAALGLAQLEQLDTFIDKKRAIAQRYEARLARHEGITVMPTPPHSEPTYWLYTVLLDEKTTLAERQRLIAHLHAQGIEARPLWHPVHRLAPYRDCSAFQIQHAIEFYARGVCLPSSVGLTVDDQERCLAGFLEAVKRQLKGRPRT